MKSSFKIFIVTFIVAAFLMLLGNSFTKGIPLAWVVRSSADMLQALVLGLGLGLIMAVLFHNVTLTLSFKEKKEFTDNLIIQMQKLGYYIVSNSETLIVFKKALSDIIPLGISVQLESDKAIIHGPKLNVSKIKKGMKPFLKVPVKHTVVRRTVRRR